MNSREQTLVQIPSLMNCVPKSRRDVDCDAYRRFIVMCLDPLGTRAFPDTRRL